MILTNISTPLLGLVDTAVLGHLDSEQFLAAVALGGLIFSFIFWGFGFFRMGTTGLTAQAFGKNNTVEINGILIRAIVLALIISALLLLFRQTIGFISFWLLESDTSVENLALQYFEIRIWSTPATLCLYVLMGWFLGRQNVAMPFVVVVMTNLLNIGLDLLFVYHLNMQVKGVALASVIAEYFGLAIALLGTYLYIKKQRFFWRWAYLTSFDKYKAMLLINSHIFVRTWCLIFAFAFFTAQSAKMGAIILAANAVLLNFQTFMAYALDGFAHAAEAVVGRAKGAKNKVLGQQAILTSCLWSFVVALLFSGLYFIFGQQIINLLTGLDNVREIAFIYLPWLIIMPLVSFLCYLFDGVFIGLMLTKEMKNTMLFSLFCVFFPLWYFTQELGNEGLWIAMLGFMMVRSLSMAIVYKYKKITSKKINNCIF
ncbi:MAG: MATE family efflux transporter [Methylococcaceae bacterium]|nr:MATE family efflux transporter [Methylococcaceae bacterium]